MTIYRPTCLLGLIGVILTAPVAAQIVPDSSVGTTVTPNVEIKGVRSEVIDGGTIRGANLFHSFSEFNIQTGRGAYFTNPEGITNIFSRITGNNPSNINGILGVLGNANLFLLNPNGIIFGAGARLDLKGSFVATTADRINFADRTFFSATNTQASPLLTVSTPVGLQLGTNSRAIRVEGVGNTEILRPDSTLSPAQLPGLQVATGQTLALVGSEIDIIGGNLIAPEGQVELWGVKNAEVTIDSPRWQLTSPAPAEWGTISLRQAALVNASGNSGGAIQIRGRGLTVEQGSHIAANSRSGQGKGVTVQTTEFVDLLGVSSPNPLADQLKVNSPHPFRTPGVEASVFGTGGRAGDITVETGRFQLANGAWLQSLSSGDSSRTGNITVRASDLDVRSFNRFDSTRFSGSAIANLILSPNSQSGQLTIEAQRVRLLDGGRVSADLLIGSGKAGNISIRASESLEIQGENMINSTSAILSSVQGGTTGQGGNITIDTGRLVLSKGGAISTGLTGTGQAGNINIRAIEVAVSDPALISPRLSQLISGITVAVAPSGVGQGGNLTLQAERLDVFNGGQLTSSSRGNGTAGNINLRVNEINVEGISQPLRDGRQLLSSISAASTTAASAGSITLVANTLKVGNGGEISVSNTGGGNAGNLLVNANRLLLDRGGSLRSEVAAGDRGNITLSSDSLLMRRASQITTNATGTATGGNINIDSPIIVGLENSDIVANAVQGNGGNIQINTQGIFGLENRPELTRESDISASSQFGVSGTVNVSVLNVNQQNVVEPPPSNFVSTDQVVANSCLARQGSSQGTFTIAGNGGLPETPETGILPYEVVQVQSAPTGSAPSSVQPSPVTTSWKWGDPIVEATEFSVNAQGQVVLIAKGNAAAGAISHPQPLSCQSN